MSCVLHGEQQKKCQTRDPAKSDAVHGDHLTAIAKVMVIELETQHLPTEGGGERQWLEILEVGAQQRMLIAAAEPAGVVD